MGKIFFYICLLAFGPLTAYSDGGAVLKDFSIRSEKLMPALIPTNDRKCTSTVFIFHQCSFNYEFEGVKQKANYHIFSFGAPKTVRLLRGAESGRLTSTVGQDYLWNRALTILFGLLMSGFFALAMIKALFLMGDDSDDVEYYYPQTQGSNEPQIASAQASSAGNAQQARNVRKTFGQR